jgi:MFS family permease
MTYAVSGERARPEWLRSSPHAWLAAIATVCFGAFMGQLDASVVALTYRAIGADFGAGLRTVQWISLTYLIALGALLVPVGRISDRIGRKRVYLWGFGLFTLASGGCALAPSLTALAAIRTVQGAGAAMLQANSVAIVATVTPPRHLRTALGVQGAAQAVGLALGPTLGGLLVQGLGWRWVFAVNVPVGVVALLAGRHLLPRTRLAAVPGGRVRGVLAGPGVGTGLLGALLAYALLFGPIVLVPAVLQADGHRPLAAGLVAAALPIGFAVGATVGGGLVPQRWDARRRGLAGLAVTAIGLGGLLATVPSGTAWPVALALTGIGLGVFIPANNALIMAAVPTPAAAFAGGLVNASRAAGTAAGTVLVASTVAIAAAGAVSAWALLAVAIAAAALTWRT